MDEPTRTQRSKALSAWLRHKPERAGLTLSKEGWATIPDVLAAFERLVGDKAIPDDALLVLAGQAGWKSGRTLQAIEASAG